MLGGQHYSDNERNRTYYKNAQHILVHTESQKKEMLQMELFKAADIRVFPLGVDTSILKPVKKQNDAPKLLYVGRILELKRIHLGIVAIKQLKDRVHPESHLKIIGPVSSKLYFESLQKMINELGLEKNISFLGPVQYDLLPSYFQEANLLILPSFKETFGMVMIEAMACGTPVAGMRCAGGPSEVISNGYDGIISTPEDYSEDIVNYFQSPLSIQKLTANARNKVLREFGISNTYEALKGSVSSILEN